MSFFKVTDWTHSRGVKSADIGGICNMVKAATEAAIANLDEDIASGSYAISDNELRRLDAAEKKQ